MYKCRVWELPPAPLPPKLRTQSLASTLDPEQPGKTNSWPKATSSGCSWKGPGGSWLAGRTGSGLSWTLHSLLRWTGRGPGRGDEVAGSSLCSGRWKLVSPLLLDSPGLCVSLQPSQVEDALSGEEDKEEERGKEEETTPARSSGSERPVCPAAGRASQVLGASEMSQVRAMSMVQRLQSCPTPARPRDAWGPSCSVLCSLCHLGQLTSLRWAFLDK